MAERRRNGRVGSAWNRVHRVLGLVSACFVLLLALTGIALNHTEALGLDGRHVAPGWLLDWYGIERPPEPVSYRAGTVRVSRLGDRLWFGTEPVLDDVTRLDGAVATNRFVVAALGDELALFLRDGRLVERIGSAAGLPGSIRGIAKAEDGGIVVKTGQGIYSAGPALTGWRPAGEAEVTWSQPAAVPADMQKRLAAAWRGDGLSLERVLLDLHSGRLLGRFGVWLMDAMALVFTVLAATGLWLWWRRRNGLKNGRGRPGYRP